MTKKNVRKTIVDTVLGKLMAAGSAANTDVGSTPPTTATNDSDSTKPPMLSRATTLSTTSSSAATARVVASTSTGTTEPPASQADAGPSDVPTVFVSNSAFRSLHETQVVALGGVSTRPRAGVCKHASALRG